MSEKKGRVYLIGAGPGDAGLLTLKGKKLLGEAQVVIYDSLVNPQILKFCRPDAELLFAGKTMGQAHISQEEINELLISKAKEGKTVARLKGGDPFVFGRGGEEAEAIVQNGIDIEIVPGVSSVTAVPAYGGIPITHRQFNSSFAVFTGHHQGEDSDYDPAQIETLVFLMGLNNIESIMKKLLEMGKKPSTPVAVISSGTLPEQRSVVGTISDIAEKTRVLDVQTPATIVVGEVASLAEAIGWYEKKPLFGKTMMVTREKEASSEFSELITSCGAKTIEFPTIAIKPIRNTKEQKLSVENLGNYDFLVFTSVNGVTNYFEVLASHGKDSRELKGKKIIAIGEKTAEQLLKYKLSADYMPAVYTAEGIVSLAEKLDLDGKKILIPRALVARELLPETLRTMGATVEVLCVYETLVPDYSKKELDAIKAKFSDAEIDLVTFTSSSTVTNFFSLLGEDPELFSKTGFACIGPVTAATLLGYGFTPAVTADIHTTRGLKEKILDL
ncbi:MAG: uroporphyrinogen-III C-methyltransferase [Candidatus Dadabacteria bacterium]|nr:uroporphyrinogen-III C-methyltransferase [Candidatus Dadabacteria bacterium]MDE0477868.1 uroporphyrinogen-III C-methyltransferase [Candidatus Dadabacteria bacterium]